MKPFLLKISSGPAISFSARSDHESYKYNNWHYHPECEIIHVKQGAGSLFVGDGVHHFKRGDFICIGSFVPHYWKFDAEYTAEPKKESFIELTQFRTDFWGAEFLSIPENQKIAGFLDRCKKGLVFRGANADLAKRLLTRLLKVEGSFRIIVLLELLTDLAHGDPSFLISSDLYANEQFTNGERLNTIYNYTLQNYRSKIYIKEIAKKTNLTENSFCRYFKSCTRKSYTQFVSELRIGHACKLLSESKKSIKEICYESGFNNIANFNRMFKKMKGMRPTDYRNSLLT